jgi:hypothetical protein
MNQSHSSSIDAVLALERSGALLTESRTMEVLAAAIANARAFSELQTIVGRIHGWTEGDLPLRGSALRALIAKAAEVTTPSEKAQVWLWVATTVYATPDAAFGAPARQRLSVDDDIQDALRMMTPLLVGALSDPASKLACAACAVLTRVMCHSRETIDALLDTARSSKSDDVLAAIALVVGLALASKTCDGDQVAAVRAFLRRAMASEGRQPQCMALVASALATAGVLESDVGTLCDALTTPVRITGVLGWGPNGDEVLSSAHYAALVLRWISVPDACRSALVSALLAWSGGERGAEALRGVAFSKGEVSPSGLARDSLSVDQQVALRQIGLDGSHELLASLGFGPERDDITAFLRGEDLPWRPVVELAGNVRWHYLKVARAAAEGEVSPATSAKAWLNATEGTRESLECCLNDYWFVEQLSDVAWAKHQDFVLEIVDEMARRSVPVKELLERMAEEGALVNGALLASALARLYEDAGVLWPSELDGLLSDALTSAKVAEPLRRVLQRLPVPRLESVLATFPALPFWDMCLTAVVVREMLEFVRLFPEHLGDVILCIRRGDVAVARESLHMLRGRHEALVDVILGDLDE